MLMLAGCGQYSVTLHPIEKSDIFSVPAGSRVLWEVEMRTHTIIVEKDGWFLSDMYLQEVMEAKVE